MESGWDSTQLDMGGTRSRHSKVSSIDAHMYDKEYQWIVVGSREWDLCMETLGKWKDKTSRKRMCLICWKFLSYSQDKRH